MIPVSLKLSNFTSYGTAVPVLDLSKFSMAAISGQNGAGKSSLLDSITWCLWGSSRLGDNSDQLIRLGQAEMEVEFSFELDNHQYTVKRKRLLKSGGTTFLEFYSGTSAKGKLTHNLTEGTIKATQAKIIEALHLSHETFVNSAFLRQGHADEFTTKGPTERKRILADILGLAHYDLLEEKAKEKAKDLQNKLKLLEYQMLEIEAELSQKDAREKALSAAETKAQEAENSLREIEKQILEIAAEKEVAGAKYQSLQEKYQRIQTAQKELAGLNLQITLKEKAKLEHQAILEQKEEIEKNLASLQSLQLEKKALETKRTALINLKDTLTKLQKEIAALEERRSTAVTSCKVDIEKLKTKNDQFQKEIAHLQSHINTCPTCGQVIDEAKNQEIITKDQSAVTENNDQLEVLTAKLKKAAEFELPQQKDANQKELEVSKLAAETSSWDQLNQQISSLLKYEQLNLKLQQASSALAAQTEALADLTKIYQSKETQIKAEEKDLIDLPVYEKQLAEAETKLQAQQQLKEELSQQTLGLRGKVGEAKQLVSRAAQLEKLQAEKKQEKAKLIVDKDAFEELSLAFGKKGIQAMIIETAIPEIEEETNRLLDRLTEGRMKVTLETQRETKTKVSGGEKGLVETLDINISDEMGERPYESYSGGEAFRVNFAIRLALSKLLTHRAGSKLQFLVIDEGFGTQDAQGRSRIVEALNSIKNDFAKILVITHLEELKEEFPVRIEVSKGSQGSTFEVVGV